MSSIPAGLARAPTLFLAQVQLDRINRNNVDLFNVQQRLATGRDVNRVSDDPVRAAAISSINQSLDRSTQWLRNFDTAGTALDLLDGALGDAQDSALEAKSIALEYVNSTFNADDRAGAAVTVEGLLDKVLEVSNRKSNVGHMFGGDFPGSQPVTQMLGGYRFAASGDGLKIDLGPGVDVPLTLGPGSPLGGTSARVRGFAELLAPVEPDTPVDELRGARGQGVQLGNIELAIDGETERVDLTGADVAGDVADAIEAGIRRIEDRTGRTLLGPQGVRFEARSLRIDLLAEDATGPVPGLTFGEVAEGTTAADLGLGGGGAFTATAGAGQDLNPRLTWLSSIPTIDDLPLGQIRIRNGGQTEIVDLSEAETIQDIRNAVEATGLGVRVELNSETDTIDLVSDLAVAVGNGLSVEEIDGNFDTAQRLGIRSFSSETDVSSLNDGRGIRIIDGVADPETGVLDPDRNTDFRVTLGDGRSFDVDLRPEDLTTMAAISTRINQAATDAGIAVPGEFEAGLVQTGPGGLALQQSGAFAAPLQVEALNGSGSLRDLGLADGTFDAEGSTLVGNDVAQVRVRNIFSDLLDLRQALLDNDETGITFAGEAVETRLSEIAQVRAIVGGDARRVQEAQELREDIVLLDEATRSGLQDTDFASAAIELSQLQVQLQAALQVTATSRQQSLLDFLG
ncbi:MAG: flagellin [Phycisphaerales bacterium]|jgi:flagellin-like hook-associated protein FlgL